MFKEGFILNGITLYTKLTFSYQFETILKHQRMKNFIRPLVFSVALMAISGIAFLQVIQGTYTIKNVQTSIQCYL